MRSKVLFSLFIILLWIYPTANAKTEPELIQIHIDTTPRPINNLIEHEREYFFTVSIENLGLEKSQGEVFDTLEPGQRYAGNFTIRVDLDFNKKGYLKYGNTSSDYTNNVFVISFYENHEIVIPTKGSLTPIRFNYTFNHSYYRLRVEPIEDVEIELEVYVYLSPCNKSCMEISGNNIDAHRKLIGFRREQYFLIDERKIEYVEGKLTDLDEELRELESLSKIVSFETSNYLTFLDTMRSQVSDRDYVSALETFRTYDLLHGTSLTSDLMSEISYYDERISNLKTNCEIEKENLEEEYQGLLDDCANQLDLLNEEYGSLNNDYENITGRLRQNQIEIMVSLGLSLILILIIIFLLRLTR